MKIIHIFCHGNEHHIPNMIRFFVKSSHDLGIFGCAQEFWVYDPAGLVNVVDDGGRQQKAMACTLGWYSLSRLIAKEKPALVVIHGLFIRGFQKLAWLSPSLIRRVHWQVWGGDLQGLQNWLSGGASQLTRQLRWAKLLFARAWLCRVGSIGVLVPADGQDLAAICPSASVHRVIYSDLENDHLDVASRSHPQMRILCGNSAMKSNYLEELIDALLPHVSASIRFVFLLSYGDLSYARRVIEYGTRKLGSSFEPIVDLLPRPEFDSFLANIDVFVSNFHGRNQQGLFSLYYGLRAGKRVFVRSDVSLFSQLKDWGFKIDDTLALPDMTTGEVVAPLRCDEALGNQMAFRNWLSKTAAIKSWRELLARRLSDSRWPAPAS